MQTKTEGGPARCASGTCDTPTHPPGPPSHPPVAAKDETGSQSGVDYIEGKREAWHARSIRFEHPDRKTANPAAGTPTGWSRAGNQNNSEEKEKGGEGGTPRRRRLETGDCACVVPGGRPYAGLGGGARAPREEGPTERRREGPTRRGEEEGPTWPGPGAPPPPPRRRAGRPARPAALPGTRRPCC